jgi:hypothetical protein
VITTPVCWTTRDRASVQLCGTEPSANIFFPPPSTTGTVKKLRRSCEPFQLAEQEVEALGEEPAHLRSCLLTALAVLFWGRGRRRVLPNESSLDRARH